MAGTTPYWRHAKVARPEAFAGSALITVARAISMGLFLFKRLITLLTTLMVASAVVFLIREVSLGDAAQMRMGPGRIP